ncbi:phosphodiesterase [Massilia arenosa]|uniref:Phosphodiesterase n=1 Tax=Zemynaea arenosa TaxID=2561931 RepID=A0A4Y9SMK4_9BURK|nr:GGDEF domain-containing phosphodiesterase [Massilia arenosa]TFW23582.1 phosphodiesterase [Massilia arenosa]
MDYEFRRLDALRRLELLDTPPGEAFDRITRMAARLFKLPIAAVSLTDSDRQWFKSRVGVEHDHIPRIKAPCGQVADKACHLTIPDLLEDPYFRDSTLAQSGIRFYSGAPLMTKDGYCLGAMCVLGTEPRTVTEEEAEALRDLAEMVMAQIELQHAIGRVDPHSGLPNRNQFMEDFADLALDRPQGEPRHLVLLNVASPEQVGHAVRALGAGVLDEVMADFLPAFRARFPGTAYQVGATQFAVLAPQESSLRTLTSLAADWSPGIHISDTSRYVATPAIGIAPFGIGEADALDVLRRAQSAIADAFAAGEPVRAYSSECDSAYRRRFALLHEFGQALEAGDQLHLVYQPRLDAVTRDVTGAEALLRWIHPQLGFVSPAEFMPLVEKTSMARPTTSWVLEHALAQLAVWRGDGMELTLSINVCAPNLAERDFVPLLAERLRRHGIPPSAVELEVTESAVMENLAVAQQTLRDVRALGVRVAIDDFGTGYSSLSYLQGMPADTVKIDQSFIREVEQDGRQRALAAAIIGLSHELGYRVVAEGVESAPAASWLAGAACDELQGYLFSRPLAPADFAGWHAAHSAMGVVTAACSVL